MPRVAIASAAAFAALVIAWWLAPHFVDDPLDVLKRRTPVKTWRDRNGKAVWCERTFDGEWRFEIPLEQVSPQARDLMLAAEDARFYSHGGVDYRACLRALWQDVRHLRIVSGASTISMQLADISHSGPRRGLWQKFVQAAKARKMESLHTKDELLEAYFNHIPYGGKLYGVEAASIYYFGKHAADITRTDASILCGIPQAPNRLRPDRHPDAARHRQRMILRQLVRQGKMAQEEADRLYEEGRLAYRDFSLPAPFMEIGEAREWTHCTNTLHTIDAALTVRIRNMLAKRIRDTPGVHDAAAVLLDVHTAETRAYVGTLDWASPQDGQVDAAEAVRSAGSVLKPFIYLEALKAGYITPFTPLEDSPLRIGTYAPKNYDGAYSGKISATMALVRSLNTPAVRLASRLGARRIEGVFDSYGLANSKQVRVNGLSLVLGSAGYRLVDVANAYARLAVEDTDEARTIASMLRTQSLEGTSRSVAWKTGTSNNHCDAWCVAFTPDWVLAVWFGNKNGRRSSNLVGAELAAPAAGEIMDMLYEGEADPAWLMPPVKTEVAGVADVPEKMRVSILSPQPRQYIAEFGEEGVWMDLSCNDSDAYWFCDGEGLGMRPGKRFFAPGRHEVSAVPAAGKAAKVVFSVSPCLQ